MKHLKLWLPATLIAAAAVLLIRIARPAPAANASLERALARQRTLPQPAVRALQAMRLVSAVQFAFFSAEKRFALPEELKQKGFLDPQWPRVDSRAYRVECESAGSGFVCYADALVGGMPWFRADGAQGVRWRPDGRPTESSPLFQ